MPANYVLLEKITVGAAGANSVTFNNIPQTGYTDLVIKSSARTDRASTYDFYKVKFNGSATSYSERSLNGNGTAAASETNNSTTYGFNYAIDGASATASTFSNAEFYIPNYTSANYKSYSTDAVTENNATAAYAAFTAGLWSNTAAITSISFESANAANFVQYSTFYLYGVAKLGTTPAIVPYATGGDTIMTDGTYWYHTFISSGTFTPQKSLTCDYLVVAGGAGGGQLYGGGGGAGGLRSTVTATGGGGSLETPLSLGTSAYTVTVGAGGAQGASGSNSVFATITSTGGGFGGTSGGNNGSTGGSGGGGTYSKTGGAGTANQGYAGGNGAAAASLYGGGGGGGAGAVGSVGTTLAGGNGGNGVAVSISGSSVTYAGGGGGGIEQSPGNIGTGGTGGGGSGAKGPNVTNATAGTANTGGGGGGGAYSTAVGAAGGSGIVIVRYAV